MSLWLTDAVYLWKARLRYVSFDYDVSLSIRSVTLLLRYAINRKCRKLTRFPDL